MSLSGGRGLLAPRHGLWLLGLGLPLGLLLALGVGRFEIPLRNTLGILLSQLIPLEPWWSDIEERLVTWGRLPRVLLAALIGAGLAVAGAALQGIFRNPLADPQLIGVSAGAACGGVLAILLDGSGTLLVVLALIGGLGALYFVRWLAGSGGGESVLTLILAGVVVSAVFGALVALAKFVADPQNQLPTIVFWLMGSLAGADYPRLLLGAVATSIGLFMLWLIRFQLHVMSLGEDDARALGLPVTRVRTLALIAVALITAASVAVCGVIGWVGLVIPHLTRLLFGAHFAAFIPLTALLGALYLVGVDTLARSLSDAEIPLGALTALVGAPMFAYLLRRLRRPEGA
ncbi:MAG: iron ABC transporter permease [Pseudomonadota bacterium]